ncbi:hypothetical protein Tco_0966429 [Tanacetum coccineum]
MIFFLTHFGLLSFADSFRHCLNLSLRLVERLLVNMEFGGILQKAPFWALNKDILKITILKTNMLYPSRKIRRIRACTHQRPQRKEDQYAEVLIRASRLKKVMADKGKKSSMEIFAPNDKADYYSRITSITVNEKNAYELKENS